ncbi:MAG: FecR domain-containing protein [Pirellulales bacterium]|nr:FecR domain-containing protein [Pirellulales bacterium]
MTDVQRVKKLLSQQADERLSDAQWDELVGLVSRSEEARDVYIEFMLLHAMMHRLTHLPASVASLAGSVKQDDDCPSLLSGDSGKSARSPILGFLGDAFAAGTKFFSRPTVLTLGLAIGLPALLVLMLVVGVTHRAGPDPGPVAQSPPAVEAAVVLRSYQCVWADGEAGIAAGSSLAPGHRIQLRKGLVEIGFLDGATVVLEGPATFDTQDGKEGFLHAGSLVANVPKGAEGFSIGTPATTVVDLGTEFGIRVDEEKGTAEVQVFQGAVELRASKVDKPDGPAEPAAERLTAGRAVRVELTVEKDAPLVVKPITPVAERFVRQMPSEASKPAIVADFSGGSGIDEVDQFAGKVGNGWASDWRVTQFGGCDNTYSIENSNPLREGGNYLKILGVRTTDAEVTGGILSRTVVTPKSSIDYGKPRPYFVVASDPYIVTFDLRVDDLGQFDRDFDTITISMGGKPGRYTNPNTCWAVRVAGGLDSETGILGRHWKFHDGDGKGGYREVDSGVTMEEGRVYNFRILVDPPKKCWTPSISVDGGPAKTFKPQGIRSRLGAEEGAPAPFFLLQWHMKGGNKGKDLERIGFSLDSIRIDAAKLDSSKK